MISLYTHIQQVWGGSPHLSWSIRTAITKKCNRLGSLETMEIYFPLFGRLGSLRPSMAGDLAGSSQGRRSKGTLLGLLHKGTKPIRKSPASQSPHFPNITTLGARFQHTNLGARESHSDHSILALAGPKLAEQPWSGALPGNRVEVTSPICPSVWKWDTLLPVHISVATEVS